VFRKTVLAMLFLGAATPLATAQSLFFPARNDYESGFGADHLATGDFDGDGILDVATAGGDDDTLHIFLGDGRGLFFFGDDIVLPFGSFPGAIVAGKFDTGTTVDLAVAVEDANGSGTAGTTGGIRILLGNGDGTFTAGVVEAGENAELSLTGLVTGNLNGDAFGDLVLLNSGSDSFQVFVGTNSGDFTQLGATTATCDRPTAAALGDLNATPGTDMVIVCDPTTGPSSNGVVRRYGGVAGVFIQIGTDLTPTTLRDPRGVVIADLNNDNSGGIKNDVAIANSRLDSGTIPDQGSVTVLRGDGVGGLVEFSPASFVIGFNTVSVAAGDIDDDGITDLILANFGSEDISVLKGSIVNPGQASARPNYVETFFAAGFGLRDALFADTDGAGNLDVLAVASNGLTGTLSSFLGGGPDLVQRALRLPMPRNVANVPMVPNALAAAAFNADAFTDLAVANLDEGTVSIFNSTAANTYSITKISGFDSPFDVVAADVDNDTDNDLMVLTSPLPGGGGPISGQVFTYLNNGAGLFTLAAPADSVGFSPFAMVVAQLTADNRPDLAITNSDDNSVTILSGGPGGNFTNTSTFSTINGGNCSVPNNPDVDCTPQGIAAGDLDGDGDQDLVVVDFGDVPPAGSTIQVFKNSGTGTFTHFQELSSVLGIDGLQAQVVRVGDLDGVNGPDVFVVSFDPDDLVAVFLNTADATGTLAEGPDSPFLLFDLDFPTRFAPRNTALTDLNGDGILDFAITGEDTNNVSVGLGAGDGSFFLARVDAFGTTQVPTAVAVADTDGDGLKDLVVTGEGNDDLALLGSGLLRRSDMDGTGRVDGFDLALLGRLFGTNFTGPEYDFYLDVNLDGFIDGLDLTVLAVAFGTVF